MYGIDRRRYLWVSVSALLQGLLLGKYMYADTGLFLALPLPLIIIVPFALWLGQEHWGRRLMRFLGALTAILSVFCAYWLWSVWPADAEVYFMPPQNMYLTRICAVVFMFLPFFQCRIAMWSWRVPYSEVFFQLCRNIFLLFQAVIVTVIFWALLLTASLLFDIIGLDFVPHAVFSPLVAFPLTSLTIALSITLALKHPGIDSLGRWILAILAWLLPPFSILSVVFVIALPFSGLRPLWATGQASSLMLLLQLATILLANAAWLDGTRAPFSNNKTISAAAKLSLLCLPIYTGLCLYSLGIRIQQYGWSVDRVQAAFFVVMAGIWGIGYAGAVLLDALTLLLRWRQERSRAALWPSAIGKINTVAALLLALIVVAMNSPLLDPYRLSANNQVDRLLAGRANPESFDFSYLRFSLGRYGSLALSRLAESDAGVILAQVSEALSQDPKEHWGNVRDGIVSEKARREILAGAKTYPDGRDLPQAFVDSMVRQWGRADFYFLRDVRGTSDLAFSFKKFGTENDDEYLLLVKRGMGLLIDVSSPEPRAVGTVYGYLNPSDMESGDVEVLAPKFNDIWLGDTRYQIVPR